MSYLYQFSFVDFLVLASKVAGLKHLLLLFVILVLIQDYSVFFVKSLGGFVVLKWLGDFLYFLCLFDEVKLVIELECVRRDGVKFLFFKSSFIKSEYSNFLQLS